MLPMTSSDPNNPKSPYFYVLGLLHIFGGMTEARVMKFISGKPYQVLALV